MQLAVDVDGVVGLVIRVVIRVVIGVIVLIVGAVDTDGRVDGGCCIVSVSPKVPAIPLRDIRQAVGGEVPYGIVLIKAVGWYVVNDVWYGDNVGGSVVYVVKPVKKIVSV